MDQHGSQHSSTVIFYTSVSDQYGVRVSACLASPRVGHILLFRPRIVFRASRESTFLTNPNTSTFGIAFAHLILSARYALCLVACGHGTCSSVFIGNITSSSTSTDPGCGGCCWVPVQYCRKYGLMRRHQRQRQKRQHRPQHTKTSMLLHRVQHTNKAWYYTLHKALCVAPCCVGVLVCRCFGCCRCHAYQ